MSILTTEFIKAATGFKLKFNSYEELYPLFDFLTEHLPQRAPTLVVKEDVETAPKKVKKAKKVSAAEAELLAPADATDRGVADGTTPTLGATDPFRSNKYRLATLDPSHCLARKIDEANPIAGTRPGDDGANGKVFPETQCSKKAVPGGLLCATCAKKEAEYYADTAKVPKGWYGRLDAPLFHKSFVVGCEWFLTKYPMGIAEAPITVAATSAITVEPTKAKKAKKPAAESEPDTAVEPVAVPVKAKKAKKPAAEPPESTATETTPVKMKKAVVESDGAPVTKPVKVKKASVAVDGDAHVVEWVTFVFDGTPLVRHTKTGNVYQCDRTKHRLEDMVQRDKYEGKWRDGRLDPYADEDDE
jgi:hypothetical protein